MLKEGYFEGDYWKMSLRLSWRVQTACEGGVQPYTWHPRNLENEKVPMSDPPSLSLCCRATLFQWGRKTVLVLQFTRAYDCGAD